MEKSLVVRTTYANVSFYPKKKGEKKETRILIADM